MMNNVIIRYVDLPCHIHAYTLTDAEAQVLIDAGYSEYLTPVV